MLPNECLVFSATDTDVQIYNPPKEPVLLPILPCSQACLGETPTMTRTGPAETHQTDLITLWWEKEISWIDTMAVKESLQYVSESGIGTGS